MVLIIEREVRETSMDIQITREEIIRRSKVYKEKQRQRTIKALEWSCAVLLLSFVTIISRVAIVKGVSGSSTYYGTLLLGKEAGAYILVGIICFLIGVVVTLIAFKKREGDNNNNEE